MYYFDATRLHCQHFKVLECLGINDNRFNSAEECAAECERTACKPGESLLIANGQVQLCGTEQCPANYICRYDALFRRHVCCGYSNSGACAAGYRTYMSAREATPFKCNVNYVKDECPPDYLCTSSTESSDNYCCSLEKGYECLNRNPNSIIGFCCMKKKEKSSKGTHSSNKNRVRNGTKTGKIEPYKVAVFNKRFTTTTAVPVLYNTRQLRIVDIQKEIDRQNLLKDKQLKTLSPYTGFPSMDDDFRCPLTHRQIFYEDGSPIECHLFKKCPDQTLSRLPDV
ncbi:unnamed protein product [Enterobius vermicularis]|uniref:BPTI/Kunitz inhibitor domain-containing protein n=1 Tax=Enterobius vermicularis TaxID=51028 RepID=A0A0N4VJT3_ENTVE|nr:unnamed protein product [Enterobius vermicularis]